VHLAGTVFNVILGFLRVRTFIMLHLFLLLGYSASLTNNFTTMLFTCSLILGGWYIHATSVNDIADREIDKINLNVTNERPLLSGNSSVLLAEIIHAFAGVVVLVASYVIGADALFVSACVLMLNYAYSLPPFSISHRGILAPLMLSLGYVLYPFYLGFRVSGQDLTHFAIWIAAGLYVSFIGRIILKDFRDVIGDKKHGKRTFIVRHGVKSTVCVAMGAWVLGGSIIVWQLASTSMALLISAIAILISFVLLELKRLTSMTKIKQQVAQIGLIGRSGNIVALFLLFGLTHLSKTDASFNSGFFITLFIIICFGLAYIHDQYRYVVQISEQMAQ